ncbi:hypothetical protein C2G38_2228885 [Gigaspora rosea]|uniref:Uncharacterized protein n=1 Tax=Gigaspora rosea TaxID=44941 RepID=A0A397TYP4_9GLOM|nr:hypothetical protein C2G38_2228885 [Gigaspora rosea]
MTKKNLGPCSINNCQIRPNQYHGITEYALRKAKEKGTFNQYNYLEVGKQLCYPHYLKIVEPDRHNEYNNKQDHIIVKNPLSFREKISLMTKVLYEKQRNEHNTLELTPDRFQTILEDAKPQLVEFFDELYNTFIPETRSAFNRKKDKKKTISQGIGLINFDQINLLTVHCYNDAIKEKEAERTMEGIRLVEIKESQLHSLDDYLNVLKMILLVNKNAGRTNNHVMLIVADWPRQLFIQKALTNMHQQNTKIPASINAFIPILGPLHISLNSRKQVLKDIEYRMLIDLLDNVIYATLDVYAVLFCSGSFDEYVETHPMLEVVKMFLVNFNDYFIENFHSKIWANTSSGDSVDTIIKQACVLVDLMFLSTGYSTSVPPSQGLCDNCFESLSEKEWNVNSFLKRLEKGANNITKEDKIEESQDSEETEEDMEKHEFIQERNERDVLKLQNALEDIDKW